MEGARRRRARDAWEGARPRWPSRGMGFQTWPAWALCSSSYVVLSPRISL